VKIAIPVKGRDLENEFSRAKYFIIVEWKENKVKTIDTLKNPYRHLRRSAKPLVFKMLKDKGVEAIAVHYGGQKDNELAKEHGLKVIKDRFLERR